MHVCVLYICLVSVEPQKKAYYTLELELRMVMSHCRCREPTRAISSAHYFWFCFFKTDSQCVAQAAFECMIILSRPLKC